MDDNYTFEAVKRVADHPEEIDYVHSLLTPDAFKRFLADFRSELMKRGYRDVKIDPVKHG